MICYVHISDAPNNFLDNTRKNVVNSK
jgi:hypothetical protein